MGRLGRVQSDSPQPTQSWNRLNVSRAISSTRPRRRNNTAAVRIGNHTDLSHVLRKLGSGACDIGVQQSHEVVEPPATKSRTLARKPLNRKPRAGRDLLRDLIQFQLLCADRAEQD